MTKKEFFETVAAATTLPADVREKANEMLATHVKSTAKAASSKSNKKAEENAPVIAQILDFLSPTTPKLTSEISVHCGVSTPKASALLLLLEKKGVIESVTCKVPKVGPRKGYVLVGNPANEDEDEEDEED